MDNYPDPKSEPSSLFRVLGLLRFNLPKDLAIERSARRALIGSE
jgi:hypothetical protein